VPEMDGDSQKSTGTVPSCLGTMCGRLNRVNSLNDEKKPKKDTKRKPKAKPEYLFVDFKRVVRVFLPSLYRPAPRHAWNIRTLSQAGLSVLENYKLP